ncbi:MAG: hypothetical protein KIT73_16600 [Burkholderiales bacterium]|nr:hypothetical protein [Burkholderiales bacterium]
MNPLLGFLLLLTTTSAVGATFEERVAAARNAAEAPETRSYDRVMFDAVGARLANAFQSCAATAPGTKAPFVLVADLTPTGKPTAVDVQPRTEIAACFAGRFAALTFPAPPAIGGRTHYPVYLDMRIPF